METREIDSLEMVDAHRRAPRRRSVQLVAVASNARQRPAVDYHQQQQNHVAINKQTQHQFHDISPQTVLNKKKDTSGARGFVRNSVVRDVGGVCGVVLPIEEYRRHFRGVSRCNNNYYFEGE